MVIMVLWVVGASPTATPFGGVAQIDRAKASRKGSPFTILVHNFTVEVEK
jgi:hypothetical protein